MPKTVFILVLIFSGFFAAWTFASPPSGTIGTSVRSLFTDASGNVGIKTATPATLLDVNGAITIRGALNIMNNFISNLATPITLNDAATKAYADEIMGTNGNFHAWSTARPGTSVVRAAGECTKTTPIGTMKIARSNNAGQWDTAQSLCPQGWWMCSAADFDHDAGTGYGSCAAGSIGNRYAITCELRVGGSWTDDDMYPTLGGVNYAWIANQGTSQTYGGVINNSGALGQDYMCSALPVWCCGY